MLTKDQEQRRPLELVLPGTGAGGSVSDFWFCFGVLASEVLLKGPPVEMSAGLIQFPGKTGPRTTLGVALAWEGLGAEGGRGHSLQEDLGDYVAVPLPLGLFFERGLQRGRGGGQGAFAAVHFPQPRLQRLPLGL